MDMQSIPEMSESRENPTESARSLYQETQQTNEQPDNGIITKEKVYRENELNKKLENTTA
jgi:hypothetical protein